MRRILIVGLLAAFASAGAASAQTDVTPVEPFKVGTFDIHGVPHVGVVLRDSLVIDIEVANLALRRTRTTRRSRCPRTCWS